jgi:hypothetical protein
MERIFLLKKEEIKNKMINLEMGNQNDYSRKGETYQLIKKGGKL